ncbi:hypothetical protein NHX12_031938, partial [Muraenolepis orangiensis]
ETRTPSPPAAQDRDSRIHKCTEVPCSSLLGSIPEKDPSPRVHPKQLGRLVISQGEQTDAVEVPCSLAAALCGPRRPQSASDSPSKGSRAYDLNQSLYTRRPQRRGAHATAQHLL